MTVEIIPTTNEVLSPHTKDSPQSWNIVKMKTNLKDGWTASKPIVNAQVRNSTRRKMNGTGHNEVQQQMK